MTNNFDEADIRAMIHLMQKYDLDEISQLYFFLSKKDTTPEEQEQIRKIQKEDARSGHYGRFSTVRIGRHDIPLQELKELSFAQICFGHPQKTLGETKRLILSRIIEEKQERDSQ